MARVKGVVAWAIISKSGRVQVSTVSLTRREAGNHFTIYDEEVGSRIARVRITEITKEDASDE